MADAEKIEISNLEELKAFRDAVNAGESYKGKTVVLTADIDLQGEEWTPIGNSTNQFQGNFDGQGHTVSNLKIDGTGKSNQGFFGFTTNGSVSNLTIKNATVTGRLNVGVVAGTPYTSKYTNIKVTGHVEVEGMAYVGGVGGKNAYADWTDITVDVDETSFVKADSVENGTAYRTYVGGVIGFMGEGGHTLKNITSNINVEGSTCDVGGIVGIAHYQNNFENVSCTAKSIELTGGTETSDGQEVGAIAGVWHNQAGTAVNMINVSVSGDTKVKATYVDDETQETATVEKTGSAGLNGKAYTSSLTGDASGKLLTATKTTDAYGAVALEITKVDGAGTKLDISESEVKKVAAADTGAASFIVGDYDVAGYEGSNVVMDANGKIVGGKFTATESADSTAFSAALSENVQQQQTGGSIVNLVNLNVISVDDDHAGKADGTVVADGIIIGVNAFAKIQDAVNAAADGATIVVKGGTYADDVIFTAAEAGSVKELTIAAAAGEEVKFTGTFQIGSRPGDGTSLVWDKLLTIDGFTFAPETGAANASFDFHECHGGLTVKNSVFESVRDVDDFFLNVTSGINRVVMDAMFENCSFTGGRIQPASQAQDDLIFNNCTFTDVKINLQIGKGAIFNDSTFNYYFANGELSYIIRVNSDQAIEISGSTFNIDAAEDFAVEYEKNGAPDFGMLWARQAGNASWVVEGCEVNYTAAALEIVSKEKDFAFIYNASTDKNKALERITVIDMTSENSAEELAAILGSSSGMVNVISDGKKTVYADGVALPMDKIVVDATKTAGEVFEVDGVSYMIGINAFTTLAEAAEKAADGTLIDISGATVSTAAFVNGGTVTLTGNADLDWSKGWFFIGRGTNAQDTTLIIKDAAIGSTSDNATYGFHVSNAEKDSSSKADGTLIIDNSAVTTDYLINKNVVDVIGDGDFNDGEVDFYVKNGFYVAGRNSNETVDGVAHTACLNITNGAYVKIGNENGMGIGAHSREEGNADGKGVLNITDSKFESTQYLNCNAHGIINVTNGELVVAGKITNNGVFYAENSRITAGTIVNSAENFSVVGGTLNAGLLTNNYYVFVNGDNKLDCNIDGVGYLLAGYYDANWEAATYNIVVENEISIIQEGVWFYKGGTFSIEENAKATITSTDTSNGYTRFLDRVNVDGELTVNNIVQMYDVDVNGAMTVNGGLHLIGYKQFEVNGTLNVVTDGSGNDGSWNAIYIGVEGAYDYINSNTVKMTVSGADAKVNITGKDGSKAENVVVCYNARVDQAASLEILDGAEFVTNGDVINQGTLTIDADSMLVAATLTMADGSTLTIDADGFVSGVRKIIDLSGTSSLENKITVNNLGEGVNVVYGSDGDVTLVNVDQSEVLVNTGYTSQDAVDAALGENFKTYGGNAFESIASAVANTATNNPLKLLFTGSETVASTGIVYVTADTDPNVAPHSVGNFDGRDVTISGINNSAERLWVDLNDTATDDTVAASKLTFDNAKLNVSKLKASYNSVININNSELNAEYIQSSNLYGKGNGIINVTGSKLIGFNQTSALGGAVISLSDSELESGSYNRIEKGSLNVLNGSKYTFSELSIAQGGTLNVTDSVVVSKEMLALSDRQNTQHFPTDPAASVIVKVGYDWKNNESAGTLNLTGSEFTLTKAQYEENGEIKYTGDAQFIVGAQGTVNVTNSKFTADTVTNAGAFNVSGTSQLTIGTLTGAVKVTDAVLTDSVIGGGKGDVHTYGNVIVENGTFLNAEGSSRTGLTVMGGTTGLKGDVSTLVLGTDHARGTEVEKVLVISDGADVSVGLTGEDGSELKVGYLYARNDAEIIIEEGGKLNLNGQLSNRGTVTLKGKMEVAGVNGVGPIHLAGAGDPDEYGTMIIDGGELTDRKTSHQNANYLYTNTTMEIGHGGDQTSEVKVINGGKINTTNSYWNIYSDGVFKIQDSSVSIVAPTNNPGYGLTWTPQEFVMTNAGTIEISDASFAVDSLTNSGTITLNDTDSVTVQSLTSDHGVINLTNSTLTVEGVVALGGIDGDTIDFSAMLYQNFVISGTSMIKAETITGFLNISIDVAGIGSDVVSYKIIDTEYASDEFAYVAGYDDTSEWAIVEANGDFFMTKGDQSVLYVNSTYANDADGIVEDGKIVGYNAFANLDDAFKVNNAETIVLKSSGLALNGNADYADSFSSAKKADFTLTADEAVTVTFNGNNQLIGNVVLGENVDVILKGIDGKAAGLLLGSKDDTNAAGNTYQINGSIVNDGIAHFYVRNHKETVDVNGEIKILHYGNNQIYNKGTMNVTGTGKNYGVNDYQVTADFINVNGVVDANGVRKGGELNLVDTAADFTTFRLGNGDDETCSTVNVNNSFLKVGGFISENSSAQIKLTGSTLNYSNVPVNVGYGNAVIGLGTDVSMTLDNSTVDAAALLSYGAISAVNGSKLDIETFTNNGTVSINDATFTAGSITNSGTITLTGNAELNSNVALNGKGAKLFFGTEEAGYNGTFAGDISLAGGSVGSNYPEYGQLQIVNGNVTLTGDITGGNDSKFTVGGSIYNNDSTARATLVLKDNTVSVGAVWIGAGNDCMDDPALKDGRFKLVVDGAELTANASGNSCIRNTGAVEVVNGGTFTYRGSQNSIRSEVLVSGEKSIFNSKNLNVYGNENAGAAVLKYTDNASGEVIQGLTFGHSTKANRQGLLVVEKSSSLSVSGGLINNIGGTVSLTGSTLNVDDITNNGSFAIDYLSGMTFSGSITNSGTFAVNTDGYDSKTYLVVDYTGSADSMDYSFVTGDNLLAFNNDLYVTAQNNDVIYVNSAYTGNVGDVTADGKIVGYNAYSSFYNDGANWNDYADYFNGVEKFVLTAGNTVAYGNLRCSAYDNPTITIETVGSGAALINRLQIAGASNKCSVIIAEGSYIQVLNTGKESFVNPESTLTINGTLEVNATQAAGSSWRTYGSTSTQPGHTIVAETGKLIFNGGQVYNTGTMTVYGEMQINAEYWDAFAKLAGDETGNYASDFYIIGGSVNVDQRAFSIGGGWGSNWGEPHSGEANFSITDGGKFTSSAVVFRGGTSAVLTIDNSSMTFGNRADGSAWTGTGGGDYVSTYDGTINLTAGTLNLGVIDFVNNGTITMDHKSTIAFSTLTNSGTFTIDLSQYSDGAFKVLDSINNNYTVEMYQALLGNAYDNRFIVVNGDLFIADFADSEIYVNNNSYSGNVGDVTADGKIIGVNAFASVDDAVAAGAQSVTVSGGEYGKTGFDGVKVTIGNVTYSGAVYGGNCDENAVVSETIDLTISGGELQSAVYGGSRVHGGTSYASGGIAVAGDVNVKVTSGSVQNVFVGGDLVTQALMFVREGDINVNISGGEFNDRVYGGITVHVSANESCMAQLVGNINMTISGGDFNDRVYGGNLAGKYERGDKLTITGNISVALDVSSNSVSFAEHLVLGSSGTSAVHGNTKLTLTGLGSNLTFADNSVIVGGSGDSYYLVEGGNRTPVSFVEGTKEFAFNAFTGDLNAQIKIFDTMSFAGNSEVNFADSAINLDEISNWNFESGSLITGAANAISFNGDTINLNGSWEAGAAFELGNLDAFGDYTAWNDVTVYYGGSAVNYQFEEKESKLVITKLA